MSLTGLIIAETTGTGLHPLCLESIVAAHTMGASHITMAVPGHGLDDLIEEIGRLPVNEILVLDDALLETYTIDGFASVLADLIASLAPYSVLFPPTYRSRELAPALAARFNCSVVNDCMQVDTDAGGSLFVRQVFQGKLHSQVRLHGESPVFLIPLPGAFSTNDLPAGSGAAPSVRHVEVQLQEDQIRTRPHAKRRTVDNVIDLDHADIIVGVGRGIGNAEQMGLVRRLAELLGAELAATRPVCDEQWLPMQYQVGSSGQTVSPKLYLAIGISGATQHIVGIRGSGMIVAINRDADAPIFKIADIGIVGDLFEIVPALIEQLENRGN